MRALVANTPVFPRRVLGYAPAKDATTGCVDCAEGGLTCHFVRLSSTAFLTKLLALPLPPFPKATPTCACAIALDRSTPTLSLLLSFPTMDSLPKHLPSLPLSVSCSSVKPYLILKLPMPFADALTGSVRHEVALVEWNVVRKEVNGQQTQACVHCLFSPWRASLVTARCEAQGNAQEHQAITVPQARERPKGRTQVNSHRGFDIDTPPWMAARGGWVKEYGPFPPCSRTPGPRSIGSARPGRTSPM